MTATIPTEQLNRMSTRVLVELFEDTDELPMTPELSMVRGWLMDALHGKDAEAFDQWLFSEDDSPRAYFL